MNLPPWFKTLGVVVAVLIAGLLTAGAVAVPYRNSRPPEGYRQPRVHWNTKNSTRFTGADLEGVAVRVSQAVYPATTPDNTPATVILYDPAHWQSGLQAASLLRPLNAVLLPVTANIQSELNRLNPAGGQVLLLDGVPADGSINGRPVTGADIPGLLAQAGARPHAVLVVDPTDPATALLAAPWAAYSGDLVVFDPADAPACLPHYTLGKVEAEGATPIAAGDPADVAVAFAKYEDPANPFFGWGFNSHSLTGYRAYTLARPGDPAMALLSANLARRGKPGPLLWANEQELPQVVNNYLWSQRAAFWVTPSEGPFHHFWILGDTTAISFPAQSQADYAVEIGPYRMKGPGASGMDMLATAWVALGLASAAWIVFHEHKFLPQQNWIMRLAWPMLALTLGPFGILLYVLAYNRPVIQHGQMAAWDRPLWLQSLVATAGSVAFGGPIMVATGFLLTFFGLPLLPNDLPGLFWLGTPMVLAMIASYVVAVLISWPLYQTPMLAMFHGLSYRGTLLKALPIVLGSMAAVSLAMFPGMWYWMMDNLPMMPTEESILWFGVMYFTVFMGLLVAWPFNYLFVRAHRKAGLM